MSVIRIEFVVLGTGSGMDNTSSGILKSVIGATEITADAEASAGADTVVPDKTTHIVLIGMEGNTYVRQSSSNSDVADPEEGTKLVLQGSEIAWATKAGRFISVLAAE